MQFIFKDHKKIVFCIQSEFNGTHKAALYLCIHHDQYEICTCTEHDISFSTVQFEREIYFWQRECDK